MATKKSSKPTKKNLEDKIAELEKKLEALSATKSKPEPKPAETPKPEKPAEAPKPAEKPSAPAPANNAQALEVIYKDAAMSNPFDYKAKTPGYSPAPNRYFERLHAKRGYAPDQNWNLQKAKVTGYTAASNTYFATKQRLAYHPADKRFDGFEYKIEGIEAPQAQQTQQAPPPPAPESTLPKGSTQTSAGGDDSRKSKLESYEAEYLARLEKEAQEARELAAAAAELAAKRKTESAGSSGSTRGTLPKGF